MALPNYEKRFNQLKELENSRLYTSEEVKNGYIEKSDGTKVPKYIRCFEFTLSNSVTTTWYGEEVMIIDDIDELLDMRGTIIEPTNYGQYSLPYNDEYYQYLVYMPTSKKICIRHTNSHFNKGKIKGIIEYTKTTD